MRAGSAVTRAAAPRRVVPTIGSGRALVACVVAVLLLATCAVGVLVHAGLYADGANYLLQIVERRGFLVVWPDRAGVNVLTQAPLVIGLRLGLHSMRTAVLLYSLGTLGTPVLIYVLALFLSAAQWYLPLVAAVIATIYPATFFMSVSESVTAYAVYLLIAVVLASAPPLTAGRATVLMLCSAALPFLYETSAFFGPLLAVWSLRRLMRGNDGKVARATLIVAAFAGLAAAATSGWAILHPVDPQAERSAGQLAGLAASHEFDAAFLALIGAVGLALAVRRSWVVATGEVVVLSAAALFTAVGSAPPAAQYEIRMAPTLILAPLFFLLWKPDSRPRGRVESVTGSRRLSLAAVALAAALATQNATLLWGWHDFFGSFEQQINASHGLVPYSQARLSLVNEYGWSWTFPTMSRIVQDSPRQGLVENPNPNHWQPFDPSRGAPRADNLYWRT